MSVSVPLYTVDDLDHFPDDGNRYELLDGILLVTPQARALHQRIAGRLHVRLAQAVELAGAGCVVSPGAVTRAPGTQLQPDILVYPARFGPMVDWNDIHEHWLAVEIYSASSRIYDRDFKRAAYFALGVAEVWLVDIADRSVDVWRTRDGHAIVHDTVRWQVPGSSAVVTVDLAALFEGTG